jgi:acyl carrier protein
MERFLERMAEVLELDEATAETVLRDCEVWDSLTALSIVAMIDKHYGVTITADDLRNSITAGDLQRIVESRKQ